MSVSVSLAIDAQILVPFRGVDRGHSIVGSISGQTSVTGDGSGGTATVNLTATRQMWGFHPLIVLTGVTVVDDLAAAGLVRGGFSSAGNERLFSSMFEVLLSVQESTNNWALFKELTVPIEPSEDTAAIVFAAVFETNTNLKVYDMRFFGVVWDMEAMARSKHFGRVVDLLMAGVR